MSPYLKLIRFDKPVGTLLLLWPILLSIVIASNLKVPLYEIITFTLGVFLTRSAGCVFNDIADRKIDGFVERTKDRPLISGKITTKQALIFGIILSLAALILSIYFLKISTLLFTIPAFILFTTYPYFKRFFPLPQAYLGIAFSFGILMVFWELQNKLPIIAFLLFIANVVWVIGYDTIYSLTDYNDDIKLNINTAAIFFGKNVKLAVSIFYGLYIVINLYLGYILEYSRGFYFTLICSSFVLLYQIYKLYFSNNNDYLALFKLNNYVGLLTLLAYLLNTKG